MTSNDLILTIGNLSSTAIECGVEEMTDVGTVTEVETGRKGRFFEIKNQNFIWGSFPKPFDASSMNEMAETICEMNFKSILILEAQASQVAGIRPGIYQISIGKQQNLPKLPTGFAAQGELSNKGFQIDTGSANQIIQLPKSANQRLLHEFMLHD